MDLFILKEGISMENLNFGADYLEQVEVVHYGGYVIIDRRGCVSVDSGKHWQCDEYASI